MADLTPERLQELRRIAEEATPGPWAVNPWQAVVDEMETLTPICGRTEEQTLANAQHIAAFDPTTALELLDALAAARAEAERWRRRHDALRAAVIKADALTVDANHRAPPMYNNTQDADYESHSDGLDEALMILDRKSVV